MSGQDRALANFNFSSSKPLWQQINAIVRSRLTEGMLAGAQISDAALAAEFGVSRMTVRQALQPLVTEGILVRERGRGTFVASPPVLGQLSGIERFFEEWRLQGRSFRVDLLERVITPATSSVATALSVEEGENIGMLRRLRFVDERPIVVDTRYLPGAIDAQLSDQELVEESIWLIIERRLGIPIDHADFEIHASPASDEEAELLGLTPGVPLLDRRLQIAAADGRPVIAGRSVYHPGSFVYRIRVQAH